MSRSRRTLEDRDFGRIPRPTFGHPAQVVTTAFAAVIAIGTILLALPIAHSGNDMRFSSAFFTSTSAVTVTGLSTVDVPNHWSTFGEVVIMVLMQVGGLGIMTIASVLGLLVSRKLGLRARLNTAAETNTSVIGDISEILLGILKITVTIEVLVALALTLRFWLGYDESLGRAAYLGVFHAVSAWNHAGFALFSDSLMSFVNDPWILIPIDIATILGSLGFPVFLELRKRIRTPVSWTLHTKMTLMMTALLLVGGWIVLTAIEWSNPATLGGLDAPSRVLAGFTASVQPRSGGLNSIDYSQVEESTLFVTTILMFIGGGSASVAGGIKVTTFLLLFYVIVAEVRGAADVEAGTRRIDARAQRQALAVALISVAACVVGTLILLSVAPLNLSEALFEAVSAFGTVGLSAGVTPDLPISGQTVLVFLMFFGRVGPVVLVSALAMRERPHHYRLPEGRPLIG